MHLPCSIESTASREVGFRSNASLYSLLNSFTNRHLAWILSAIAAGVDFPRTDSSNEQTDH